VDVSLLRADIMCTNGILHEDWSGEYMKLSNIKYAICTVVVRKGNESGGPNGNVQGRQSIKVRVSEDVTWIRKCNECFREATTDHQ
jgi:hypothetical protein